MTGYFVLPSTGSVIVAAVMLGPYVLLWFAIKSALRIGTHAALLCIALCTVCAGFWVLFDAAFIHLSTLNFLPLEVAIIQLLVAGITLRVVYRLEKRRAE